MYNAPPSSIPIVEFSNTESVMFTLSPVMKIVPPSSPAKLFVNVDFVTVTFEAVRQIVPPLVDEVPLIPVPTPWLKSHVIL